MIISSNHAASIFALSPLDVFFTNHHNAAVSCAILSAGLYQATHQRHEQCRTSEIEWYIELFDKHVGSTHTNDIYTAPVM
jgi:hypothetical protein